MEFFILVALHLQSTTVVPNTNMPTTSNSEKSNYNFYIILVGAVAVIGLIVISICLMFFCRKWKTKKTGEYSLASFL